MVINMFSKIFKRISVIFSLFILSSCSTNSSLGEIENALTYDRPDRLLFTYNSQGTFSENKEEVDYFYDTYFKDLEFVETDVVHASFTFIYFEYAYQDKYVRFDPLPYNLIIAFDYNGKMYASLGDVDSNKLLEEIQGIVNERV